MNLHDDFSQRVVLQTRSMPWEPSPMAGVSRRKLDRIGDEVARATSIVRYDPKSAFSSHVHGGGEEFLVLDGVFSDEHGDYPAGTYVRNPIGTEHRPHSDLGCTILVKLHQFAAADQRQFSVNTKQAAFTAGMAPGVSEIQLHQFGREVCRLVRFEPGVTDIVTQASGGEEIFILEGVLSDEAGDYPEGTWLRNPPGSTYHRHSVEGCLFYVKTGHLSVG